MRYLDVVGFKAGHVDYKDIRVGVFFNIYGSRSRGLGVAHIRASRGVEDPLQVVRHTQQLLHGAQQRIHCHQYLCTMDRTVHSGRITSLRILQDI